VRRVSVDHSRLSGPDLRLKFRISKTGSIDRRFANRVTRRCFGQLGRIDLSRSGRTRALGGAPRSGSGWTPPSGPPGAAINSPFGIGETREQMLAERSPGYVLTAQRGDRVLDRVESAFTISGIRNRSDDREVSSGNECFEGREQAVVRCGREATASGSLVCDMRTPTISTAKMRATGDLVVVTGLVTTYIWLWRGTFAYDKVAIAAGIIGWSIGFHSSRQEKWVDVFGRGSSFAAAFRLVCAWVALPLLGIALFSFIEPHPALPALSEVASRLVSFVAIGILQQYLLLGHIFRSAADLWTDHSVAAVVAAVIFSMLHLPNPFMVVVTLVAGIAACIIYRRAPNILAIGLGHGCLSLALYYGLPRWLTGGLRFGPGFP
jgi:membrane protease YdiL (CAAX protease family)